MFCNIRSLASKNTDTQIIHKCKKGINNVLIVDLNSFFSDTQAVLSVQIAFRWFTLLNGVRTGMQKAVFMFLAEDHLVQDIGKQNCDGMCTKWHAQSACIISIHLACIHLNGKPYSSGPGCSKAG